MPIMSVISLPMELHYFVLSIELHNFVFSNLVWNCLEDCVQDILPGYKLLPELLNICPGANSTVTICYGVTNYIEWQLFSELIDSGMSSN